MNLIKFTYFVVAKRCKKKYTFFLFESETLEICSNVLVLYVPYKKKSYYRSVYYLVSLKL